MGRYVYPSASDAIVGSASEDHVAELLARQGAHVRSAHGRLWLEARRGFFEPVHWLARFTSAQARRPGLCWGYRAALHDADSGVANGFVPIHVLDGVQDYDGSALPKDTRRYLRRLPQEGVRIVHVTDARIFEDQGYEVMRDFHARVGKRGPLPDREGYVSGIRRRVEDDSWLFLAGLAGDRLLGYVSVLVIEDTAHLMQAVIATEATRLRLNKALDHETLCVLARHEGLTEVSAGLHTPDVPGLAEYKVRLGFKVKMLPARVGIVWPVSRYLARRRPHKYYRLTGRAASGREAPTAGAEGSD